jgi:hypothetical protein
MSETIPVQQQIGGVMEEKIPVTVRLPRSDIAGLDRMATAQSTTRQDLIGTLVREAVAKSGLTSDTALPPAVLAAVEAGIAEMKSGEETSLKKLIGNELWSTLDDALKRGLGKVFKELVEKRLLPELMLGRKKSNNEQQYNKT